MKYIGKLLTAPPAYEDEFFEKAVVFVYEFFKWFYLFHIISTYIFL